MNKRQTKTSVEFRSKFVSLSDCFFTREKKISNQNYDENMTRAIVRKRERT